MTHELVIARYQEDVSWAYKLAQWAWVAVYDKGPAPVAAANFGFIPLENVGREGHTYLTHIVRRWDSLADVTVFCQGDPWEHLGAIPIEDLVRAEVDTVRVPRVCRVVEWDRYGQLIHPAQWGQWYADGTIRRSRWTLAQWFREFIGVEELPPDGLVYSPGACMAVPAERIRRRPREQYERILATLSDHVNPEEGYYLERAWLYLFARD